ncbi:DUF4167 domain-containing protein [Jannaschia sp. LMIT008]|uniref:DUF4167 domain-containing protein n=1 Tax=Jannaschia maritima TaxID=3032585 RepID=UPI0028123663|nr:DUF4167 domain-containing protein [Jannaschia sp. LMIT008]
MRSQKSRSRNKNRNRPSGGNVVNRVFDSSGPEGKVRGTPQQVIDKYNQLARDAQLAGDRVAVENFQQHAEHYTRMLAQAQKEMDAKREQQGGQQGGGNQQGGGPNQQQGGQQGQQGGQPQNGQGGGGQDDAGNGGGGGNGGGNDGSGRNRGRGDRNRDRGDRDDRRSGSDDVIDAPGDAGLVETPEAQADATPEADAPAAGEEAPKPKRRTRRKAPKADEGAPATDNTSPEDA